MAVKILVILAHPNIEQSRINKALRDKVQDLHNVTIHELYSCYPDFKIDVAKEQSLLVASDVIVFQFPFYWYSSPALLKEWEDTVLTYGFAYGSDGTALKGKKLQIVISTGGPEDAYTPKGYNNFTITQLLTPFEQTANLCGMTYLPPFAIHGSGSISDDKLKKSALAYRDMLQSMTK